MAALYDITEKYMKFYLGHVGNDENLKNRIRSEIKEAGADKVIAAFREQLEYSWADH